MSRINYEMYYSACRQHVLSKLDYKTKSDYIVYTGLIVSGGKMYITPL